MEREDERAQGERIDRFKLVSNKKHAIWLGCLGFLELILKGVQAFLVENIGKGDVGDIIRHVGGNNTLLRRDDWHKANANLDFLVDCRKLDRQGLGIEVAVSLSFDPDIANDDTA